MISAIMFFSFYIWSIIYSLARNPIQIILAYQIIYFINPGSRWWFSYLPDLRYSFFCSVTMIGLLAFNWKKSNASVFMKIPHLKYTTLLVILFFATYPGSIYPGLHLEASIIYIKLLIIMFAIFSLCSEKEHLDKLLYGYIAGAFYIGYVAYDTGRNYGSRIEGIGPVDGSDANSTAAAIAPAIVVAVYYFWINQKKQLKLIFLFSLVFIVNAIVLIGSRGSFLAITASMGFFIYHMLFKEKLIQKQRRDAIILIVLGVFGGLYLADDAFIERIKTITENTEVQEEQETAATRLIFWKSALEMSKEHPFGEGYRAFEYYSPQYIPQHVDTGRSRNRAVHSTWFQALTEVGYLGLLLLILSCITAFKATNKIKAYANSQGDGKTYFKVVALQAALISFLVSMTFTNRLRAEVFNWCLLFMAVAYNLYYLKENTKRSA